MITAISNAGDKLIALVAPRETAAANCWVDNSWCSPTGCTFWWQRRTYHHVCDNGDSYTSVSLCGTGC
ncbi:hypothetical protein [Embleya hyalina]|uniref:Uncharacterized protein n=1 Tax=Embleya hyalina TaxID=516124 RepID=A0A401YN63_9ACTN|nr:hypothetical protein [Embleya hyalina]GCD96038.1 hypothetical protein EHYA_03722 [Embleya hyalina]